MVFKTLHLARQSIAKTFTHGYAQSIVAASQSSYATQNNSFGHLSAASRFGRHGAHQHQNSFASSAGHPGSAIRASQHDQNDSPLAAYYAAWQKYQRREDKEWQQFQFAKRIEWKNPTAVADGHAATKESAVVDDDATSAPIRDGFDRSYSTSAVDDFKKILEGNERAEAEAIAKVDEAISQEIVKQREDVVHDVKATATGALAETAADEVSATDSAASPATAALSEETRATSVSDAESYTEQLHQLAEGQQYADIPTVFQSMLASGVTPTASAYNALLAAAIHLPRAEHQIVPKALDVYSDMLRRRVRPDSTTFSILIELLAARATNVAAKRKGLDEKRLRYGGMEEEGKFLFRSNETDFDILAEDDSLDQAIRLFDRAVASNSTRVLSELTYHHIVLACAEANRVEDMVRIYAQMESHGIAPSTELFAPMITAFALSGDLRSAVECYDGYKALAISSDKGETSILRRDDEVYAALVKAYSACGRSDGGVKFFEKVEEAMPNPERLDALQAAVGLEAFVPQWLENGAFDDALEYASTKLAEPARQSAMTIISTFSADRDIADVATQAFAALSEDADRSGPAMALCAMHIRSGALDAAEPFWKTLERGQVSPQFIEPTAMHTIALIGSGHSERGLRQASHMFAQIRNSQASQHAKVEVGEQIDEAIEVIGQFMTKRGIVLPVKASMELMWAMIDNSGVVVPVAAHLLAGLKPDGIAQLGWDDVCLLVQVQAGMILNVPGLDIGNSTRFAHLLDAVASSGRPTDAKTTELIEKVLAQLDSPQLSKQWQMYRYPVQEQMFSPVPYQVYGPPPPAPAAPVVDDSFDPYAATTDNKGSVAITDLLDKNHGKSANHLNEALIKFKNMRRAGRHPRFFTYARLISAAAKEDCLGLAHEVLAMARQDVPLLPQYRIVRYGWVTILDAMVAACLTAGQRGAAAGFHQELTDMGTAPSANTFGLYITTLKESTKTFDEASEAVKIFSRAKAEGVEPSSFLYNALIGKLGKARRIDDVLSSFAEMQRLGIRPTSVTYGSIINALCRVSDETFAEELFEEMESMPNYKARPAPYHSMVQLFIQMGKKDRALAYHERMMARRITPTSHSFKLLIDIHATLDPVDMPAAERVLEDMRTAGQTPQDVHYAAIIHAKGCVLHDADGAVKLFNEVLAKRGAKLHPCLFQAVFESLVANHRVADTTPILAEMQRRGVELTPYCANALLHGHTVQRDITAAKKVYGSVPVHRREPSTYEAIIRAFLAVEDREGARAVVSELLTKRYPAAVQNKILDLMGGSASTRTPAPMTPTAAATAEALPGQI